MPKNSHWEQVVAEKNRELIELKEKLLINNAEHRIVLTNEKDRLENELKAKDVVIKERNRLISELEQYKAVFLFFSLYDLPLSIFLAKPTLL